MADDEIQEMLWERAAREAVEAALEAAEWDKSTNTVIFFDSDEPRMKTTVKTCEEFQRHLENIAGSAFASMVPHEDGSAVFECDEYSYAEAAMNEIEDELGEFFPDG